MIPELLESPINHMLALDPHTSARLAPFVGQVVTVDVTDWSCIFHVEIMVDGVRIHSGDHKPAKIQASISGRGNAFFRHGMASLLRERAISVPLTLAGNTDLAQLVQSLLIETKVDWEEMLSKRVGDVAAHGLARGIRTTGKWFTQVIKSAGMDVSEFVQEEAQFSPTEHEVHKFSQGVDECCAQIDRIEARLNRLSSEAQSQGVKPAASSDESPSTASSQTE